MRSFCISVGITGICQHAPCLASFEKMFGLGFYVYLWLYERQYQEPSHFVVPTSFSTWHEPLRSNSHLFFFPQSEYIAPCDCRRAFVSGFDGSAGESLNFLFLLCLFLLLFPSKVTELCFSLCYRTKNKMQIGRSRLSLCRMA